MNQDYLYTTQKLYEATNNGLDILFKYLNNLPSNVENGKKAFCYRNEKTASAYIRLGNSCYNVCDFGDTSSNGTCKTYSPVDVVMDKMGGTFAETIKYLYKEFNIEINGVKQTFAPKIETKILLADDTRDSKYFELETKEYEHLSIISEHLTIETCKKYNFVELQSYSKITIDENNKKKLIKITATKECPLFAYQTENNTFAKIYNPNASEPKYKHTFVGTKESQYIYGYQQLINEIENLNQDEYLDVFICSGGSDGLALASFGFHVIWTNSEAEKISKYHFDTLNRIYKNQKNTTLQIYNVPDIDKSGVKYAYSLSETYMDIKNIFLPKEQFYSNGKDFRDWLKFHRNYKKEDIKYKFINFTKNALQCNFIDYNSNGKPYIITTFLHYFLKTQGFGIYEIERNFNDSNVEKPYIFVRKIDNIIYQYFEEDIRKYVEKYFYNISSSISIIDLIKNTDQFKKQKLSSLDKIEVTEKNFDKEMQRFYFANNYVEITKDAINFSNYKSLDSEIWHKKILKNKIFQTANNFEVYFCEENQRFRPKFLIKDNQFMNYLINGSRVFWKKELQDFPFTTDEEKNKYCNENKFTLAGENLSNEEIAIQEAHFLNKIYNIGYLLHRYKVMSNAKMVYIMDDKLKTDENDSNGRSGKSLMVVGVQQLLTKDKYIDGKSKDILTDKHIFDGYDKDTEIIYLEDLDQHASIQRFYNLIASKIPVNPKHGKPYTVAHEDTCKMVTTSNFGIANLDASTFGRLSFVSFSDYYHLKIDTDDYQEERTPRTEFGNDFFDKQWYEKQNDLFFNFLFQCCQFFLQHNDKKFQAPTNNIYITNAQAKMGKQFIDWANNYFVEDLDIDNEHIEGTLNKLIIREEMYQDYVKTVGEKYKKTAQNFKTSIIEFCKTNHYIFNPKEHAEFGMYYNQDKKCYVKGITTSTGKRKTAEHFAICTKNHENKIENIIIEEPF